MLLNFRFNAFYQAEPTRRTDSNGLATENYGLPWRPSLTSVCVCVYVFYACVRGAFGIAFAGSPPSINSG